VKKPRKVLEVYPQRQGIVEEQTSLPKHTKLPHKIPKWYCEERSIRAHQHIMLWDAKKGEPTKIKRSRKRKLVRISKKSGEVIK